MIYQANIDDLEQIQLIACSAYQKYVPIIGKKPAPMVADFVKLISQQCVYIEKHGEETITGFIVFYPISGSMHLENIAVAPNQQGMGVGKRLIEFCEMRAKEAGCTDINLYTNEKMYENIPYYERLGYREVERRIEEGFSRIFFVKQL